MNHQMSGTQAELADRASELGHAAGRQFDRALDNAETVARSAADHGRQALDSVGRTVRDQPVLALAVVAAAGIAIGALWKMESGSRRRSWY